jgi:hypothetical protein
MIAAVLLTTWSAHAQESDAPRAARENGPTLYIEGGAFEALTAPYLSQGFQVAAGARVSRSLSVGAIGSWSSLSAGEVSRTAADGPGGASFFKEDNSLSLGRTSAEARWHWLGKGAFGAWVGGEAGIAGLRVRDSVAQLGGASGVTVTEHHLAPLVGLATGARFHPVELLSIGVEGRAQLMVFDHSQFFQAPQGRTGALIATLNVGFHIPFGPREPARSIAR